MKRIFLAGAAALCATPALADQTPCVGHCRVTYQLASVSDSKSYGLLLEAPISACGRVRYSVSDGSGVLGRSPTLVPGALAVVRIGGGFAEGSHGLTIATSGGKAGCASAPIRVRRVTLGKASPDHDWMASD